MMGSLGEDGGAWEQRQFCVVVTDGGSCAAKRFKVAPHSRRTVALAPLDVFLCFGGDGRLETWKEGG